MHEFWKVSHGGFGERNSCLHLSKPIYFFAVLLLALFVVYAYFGHQLLEQHLNTQKELEELKLHLNFRTEVLKSKSLLAQWPNELASAKKDVIGLITKVESAVESQRISTDNTKKTLEDLRVSVAKIEALVSRPSLYSCCSVSQQINMNTRQAQ